MIYYAAVFKTNILEAESLSLKFWNDLKFEIIKRNRVLTVSEDQLLVVPLDSEQKGNLLKEITLEDGVTHILIQGRLRDYSTPSDANEIKFKIDEAIATLAAIYSPKLFVNKVYKGFVKSDSKKMPENKKFLYSNNLAIIPKITFSKQDFNKIHSINSGFSKNQNVTESQFRLMSKMYSKAISNSLDEVRYFLLWSVLEVFPMKKARVELVTKFLANYMSRSVEEVENVLKIKSELKEQRVSLVHYGYLDLDDTNVGEVHSRLEDVVTAVLRACLGLDYNGELDYYFDDSKVAKASFNFSFSD
tara:strand:+ start:242 stop:1150 length:909 start_codon:yes stop_codon:yes gene_type:complete